MVYWIGMHSLFGLPIGSIPLVGGVRITHIFIGHVFRWPSYSCCSSRQHPAIRTHAPYPVALFVQREKCWLLDGSSDHRSIHISDITFLCAFHSKYRNKRDTAHFISLTQMVTNCLCLCDWQPVLCAFVIFNRPNGVVDLHYPLIPISPIVAPYEYVVYSCHAS